MIFKYKELMQLLYKFKGGVTMNWFTNFTNWGGSFALQLLAAVALLVVAWIVATIAKKVVEKVLLKTNMDRHLSKGTDPYNEKIGQERVSTIGKIVFLLVFVLFLPSILDRLDMQSVSAPITNMMNNLLAFIPKLIGAAIVLFAGYFVAKIVRDLARTFLITLNVDKFYNKINPDPTQKLDIANQNVLADVLSKIVFGIILIPVITVALEILDIKTLTEPIVAILNKVLMMIPNVFVAIILLVLGYYIAKFVGQILESLLLKIGIQSVFSWADQKTNSTIPRFNIAKIVSGIVKFLIMLFITVEALNVLNLAVLNGIGTAIIGYTPLLISGLLIIGVGVFAGYFVEGLIKTYTQSHFAAIIAKYIIIIFAIFMTLEQIKFASTIVNLAFLLVLGGMSVAFALAFGLGGRDFAGRQLQKVEKKIEDEKTAK